MRDVLRRPHKDDFHEQRQHEQKSVGVLRHTSESAERGRAPPMLAFRKIAVITDLSLSSRRAVDVAVELAIGSSAELVVAHWVDTSVPPYPVPLTPDIDTLVTTASETLDLEVQRVRESVPAASKKLLYGGGAERIAAFVEADGISLLLFGASTPWGVSSADVEKVVGSVLVPVIVVGSNTTWLGRQPLR